MIDILWLMAFLGISAGCNWVLAFYKKLGVEQVTWDWKAFFVGICKVALIGAVLISIAFVWNYVPIDLSPVGLEPQTVLSAGILYYFGKAIQDIAQIVKGSKAEPVMITEETITELTDGKGESDDE